MTHRIVIVGGGAGGLELATRLGRRLKGGSKASVTLVDSNLTHIWKPLFHEVAAGSLNTGTDEVNYIAQARWNGFSFQHGKMIDLQRSDKKIVLQDPYSRESRTLEYDTLVISVGSLSNDFGTKGVQEHCLFLDSRLQAERLHRELLMRHMKSHVEHARSPLRVAIVGAGATGVELSAELHNSMHLIHGYGLKNSEPGNLEVTLIEAAPRVLPALNERISTLAKRNLEKLGVTIKTGVAVKEVNDSCMLLSDDTKVIADFKIWAAGIRAPDFLKSLHGLEVNRINQLLVKPTLQTTLDDDIFAFGDCASCPIVGQDKMFVPPRAQAANQQAKFLANSLTNAILKKPLSNFIYQDKGTLISISTFNAVGVLGQQWFTHGRIARLLYLSLYRAHQTVLFGIGRTLLKLSSEFLQRKIKPRLKMH